MNTIEEEKCSLDTLRMDVCVYGSAPVDAEGNADEDSAYCSIMDNAREWGACDRDPYYCQSCGRYFQDWETAKTHVGVEAA